MPNSTRYHTLAIIPASSSLVTCLDSILPPSTASQLSASRHASKCLQHGTFASSRLSPPNSTSLCAVSPCALASDDPGRELPPYASSAKLAHEQFHAVNRTTYLPSGACFATPLLCAPLNVEANDFTTYILSLREDSCSWSVMRQVINSRSRRSRAGRRSVGKRTWRVRRNWRREGGMEALRVGFWGRGVEDWGGGWETAVMREERSWRWEGRTVVVMIAT